MGKWIANLAERVGLVVGGGAFVIWVVAWIVIVVTFFWDALAWLTNNQDNWRNTGFRASLISLAVVVVVAIVSLPIVAAMEAVVRSLRPDPKAPPTDPDERYRWANRLPPYDQ